MQSSEFRKILQEEFKLAGVLCLQEEEKVIIRDLIQMGRWIKYGVLFSITVGIAGISSLSAAIFIGVKFAPIILEFLKVSF